METSSSVQEVSASPKEVIELAEQDLNVLSGLVMAEHMMFLFPPMFVAIWQFLKSKVHLARDFSQLAIGIPRGFAKTTVIKLWIVYCILFTTRRFVLVISSSEDHAINIIKDACEMLSSSNIISLFGDWKINKERDQANCKIFRFRSRRIILAGYGANGSIRGLNVGLERPDVMIFEDYQDKEESENEELSKKLFQKMLGTHMKAKSNFGCLFIFVANMYPTQGSILKKLKGNPDWLSFIVGAILEDGTSLWEELQPLAQLIDEYEKDLRAGHPEVFLAEKLNDENAGIKSGVDITKLPQWPWEDDDLAQGKAIVIDPALDNPSSNYNGVGLVELYDGKPGLRKVVLEKFTPLQLIKEALKLGMETGTRLILVENVAYQASLLFWFNEVCQQSGIDGFQFMPLQVQGKSKNSKIITGIREWSESEIHVHPDVRPLAINEIIKFDPKKAKNDDTVLDLVTFCKKSRRTIW
jgi:hypothetical protein